MIMHRSELRLSDLAGLDRGSFTAQYFRSASESRMMDQLSKHDNDLLGGWIRGLFEAEGINDDLMSMCKPAEFHLLIATLFDQSIKACQVGTLTIETLKGGFEYLLEPFLLPSLVAGLTWFGNTLWSISPPPTHIDTLMPALHTLLKPPSMSADAAAMHSTILVRVAESLDSGLRHAQRQHKNRVDIQPLLEILKPYMTHYREKAAALSELETWTKNPPNGLSTAMSNTIQGLVLWCVANGNMSPPKYSHSILLYTQQLLGTETTMKILIEEIMGQVTQHGINAQETDTVFDIIVTMIVAPQTNRPLSSLKNVLRIKSREVNELSKKDIVRATVIVRLHRRVEALAAAMMNVTVNNNDLSMGMATSGQGMMLRDSQGMPATDIDAVLAHTEGQIASGDFQGVVGLGSSMDF
ncbi:MAG: hypothetical protein Q9213_002128 [Squamulea squamosa]